MNLFINRGKLPRLAIATILAIPCDSHCFSSHGCLHHLRVIASSEVQVWAGSGNANEFRIAPKFDQATTLRMICGLAVICILWFAYQLRIGVVTSRARESLAERLAERERIADELHDSLLQNVQGLVLLFDGISAQIPKDPSLAAKVNSAIDRAQQLLDETRDRLRDLHMVSFDLASAFRQLGERFQGSTTQYDVSVEGTQPELQFLMCDEIFQFGQEAIRNAFQHAEASVIHVDLTFRSRYLRLRVQDDGKGLDQEMLRNGRPGHRGLANMRERARKLCATLHIVSAPGQGTTILMKLPRSVVYRSLGF